MPEFNTPSKDLTSSLFQTTISPSVLFTTGPEGSDDETSRPNDLRKPNFDEPGTRGVLRILPKEVQSKRLYVFGGSAAVPGWSRPMTEVEYFDFDKSKWEYGENMRFERKDFGVAPFQGQIWIAGGRQNKTDALNIVDIYDPTENQWSDGPLMRLHRRGLGLANFRDMLFAVGGNNGNQAANLSSVEIFNFKGAEQWKEHKAMNRRRANMGIASLENMMIVVGGEDFGSQSTMEFYNVAENAWTLIGPANLAKRERCSAALANGNLFVTGGRRNAINRYSGANLDIQGTAGSVGIGEVLGITGTDLVSSGGVVFRLGGQSDNVVLSEVSWYDEDENRWIPFPKIIRQSRFRPRAVILDWPVVKPEV